jgi:hypothetical protein
VLTITDGRRFRTGDGGAVDMSRRTLLRAGALAAVTGVSATRPVVARSTPIRQHRPAAKSCIVLFLMGGAPQQSLWDLKPHATDAVRSEIRPIETTVPGLQIGELLSSTALLADRLAVLRAVSTNDNAHSSSGYWMLTGQPHAPLNVENANPGAPNNWPNVGAVVQSLSRGGRRLPPAVRLPHHIFNTDQSVWPGQDAGWLGPQADPWLFQCQPADPQFRVPQFTLQADQSLVRLGHRQRLREQLERHLATIDRGSRFAEYEAWHQQAMALFQHEASRQACDLDREPPETRDRYGRHSFGQSVLLARRLVEAGVEFVHVNWYRGPDEPSDAPCWDSHVNETARLRTALVPPFDQAFSALLSDLRDRGRLDDTLVLVLSEFGRTPRWNGRGGRDHWGHVFSVVMAGGGVRGGTVWGSSDRDAAYPTEGLVLPQDITATMFHQLGYDPAAELLDPQGRPFPLSRGTVIHPVLCAAG